MNTKLIAPKALTVIDQYQNFQVAGVTISMPYFNNRHSQARLQLRVNVGKGSPQDLFEEIQNLAVKEKVDLSQLSPDDLKKFLVEHDLGIDCSGLAYYILNALCEDLGKGTLDKHLSFPFSPGFFGKIKAKLRPIENASVAVLAHKKNSQEINLTKAEPGDFITMENAEHNHILIIHQIEYQNFIPITLHYTHAMTWPTDGQYNHGVKQGKIEITDINKNLLAQRWIEADQSGEENYTFKRAQESTIGLRRLAFLC